ncbi:MULTISPECIES: CrcB family protein [unclassified Staphylococcus]|uniref:fluoride efflux transporter FluC n=1 Tax=unclassified Staphylococcus TaxID=91994 RepID=UPI0021D15E32|nr:MULTISPECIES: CrcB family protein [unclassified Staphylococcus]UXR68905.1 CrcB family protein [Staphylococcus sp. IVB6246]UXR70962.1 CrcB family protein [Staphylococcus sp. IVB6240]UXR73191.1 CrcB family protein [Staphylococcus sp. IVB6238]UXR75488.1 CrcB family protein [Staphylococcus sp. IVB6233]UXR79690.1 CrcB family protein [Staphylococcus sp. IVB6218]
MTILLILLGGGMGATLRAMLTDIINHYVKTPFPVATSLINLLGSCLIGFLGGVFITTMPLYSLFITGILGGFTTFSTFQLDLVQQLKKRQWIQFGCYSLLQFFGCFISCYIGTQIL